MGESTTPEPHRPSRPDPEFPLWSEMPEPPLYAIVENESGQEYRRGPQGWSALGAWLCWRDLCLAHGPFKLAWEPDPRATAPDPEWRTSLRAAMKAEFASKLPASWVTEVAATATDVAASYVLLRLDTLMEAKTADDARIAEMEENVRALGGDPDRMVDPRDHEAAIKAMREDMRAAVLARYLVALVDASAIAERHMLRMAQASLGAPAPVEQEVPACQCDATECPVHADTRGVGAPMREVPAREAREGDTVTIVARLAPDFRIATGLTAGQIYVEGKPPLDCATLAVDSITIARPVSPLPDQPGAVIRAFPDDRDPVDGPVTAEFAADGSGWQITGVHGVFPSSLFDLAKGFEVLYLPAGAGVDEGGKAARSPRKRECSECCAALSDGEKHADDCQRAI